jgi:dihydroorotate dehydrogenase electron transfer subunit
LIQTTAAVTSNKEILPGAYLLWLATPRIAREAKPGQFVMVRCGEYPLPRPFSIHKVNEKGEIALFFAALKDGKGTQWLAACKAGDELSLVGPLGNGFQVATESRRLLLVAGGMGIAPLLFLAEEPLKRGIPVDLLYGAAFKNPNMADYCNRKGIKLFEATEDGSAGYHGLVTDLIPEHTGGVDQVFACGPAPMYRAMARLPELKNIPVQVSLEVRMACGLGACLGCTIGTKSGLKRVCKDGPVFNLNEIVWEEVRC